MQRPAAEPPLQPPSKQPLVSSDSAATAVEAGGAAPPPLGTSAYERAGLWARISFSWVSPLIARGWKDLKFSENGARFLMPAADDAPALSQSFEHRYGQLKVWVRGWSVVVVGLGWCASCSGPTVCHAPSPSRVLATPTTSQGQACRCRRRSRRSRPRHCHQQQQ
jgi:hypothetical protein